MAATVNFAAPATPVTKNINVTIAEADFATFQLVELKQNPDIIEAAVAQDSDFLPAYTGTGAGASAPGLYMLAVPLSLLLIMHNIMIWYVGPALVNSSSKSLMVLVATDS